MIRTGYGTCRRPRRGAVLVLVLAAIVLLAGTATLIARRAILSQRATESAAVVVQAESVWVTAAEVWRGGETGTELRFSLPPRGTAPRMATAQLSKLNGQDESGRGEGEIWEIEVTIEERGRVIARRRGMISVPQSPTASASAASAAESNQEDEGESQ